MKIIINLAVTFVFLYVIIKVLSMILYKFDIQLNMMYIYIIACIGYIIVFYIKKS